MEVIIKAHLIGLVEEILQINYRNRGHPDKVDQSQIRMETIDSNIFSSANEMPSTKQQNLNLFASCEKFWLYNANLMY